uniref:Uncharacterized protein n=1 Tax=Ursus maritimus TaxID=29073 RepID=A0A452UD09_URSMA
ISWPRGRMRGPTARWRAGVGGVSGRPGSFSYGLREAKCREAGRSVGHLPSLLPVSRGCAQVPVDPKPGPRVRGLQFPRQGAFFPGRVF